METGETFECPLCSRIFSNVEELRYHYKITHEINESKPL